jgi:hypothetical protein
VYWIQSDLSVLARCAILTSCRSLCAFFVRRLPVRRVSRATYTYHTILHPHMVLYLPRNPEILETGDFRVKTPRFFVSIRIIYSDVRKRPVSCGCSGCFGLKRWFFFFSHNINSLFKIETRKPCDAHNSCEPRGCADEPNVRSGSFA